MRNMRSSLVWPCLISMISSACGTSSPAGNTGPAGGKADNGVTTMADLNFSVPGLTDAPIASNEYCTFADSAPYVRDIKWNHPRIAAVLRQVAPGWRSMFAYREWQVPYALENEDNADETVAMNARSRNFVRVLLGEHRDYPALLESKIDSILANQTYAAPGEVKSFDLDRNLFNQISYPAYRKLVDLMRTVYQAKREPLRSPTDSTSFTKEGGDSNRVDNSVAPFTQCEMKYIFSRYLVEDGPTVTSFGGAIDLNGGTAGGDDFDGDSGNDDFDAFGEDAGVPFEGDAGVPFDGDAGAGESGSDSLGGSGSDSASDAGSAPASSADAAVGEGPKTDNGAAITTVPEAAALPRQVNTSLYLSLYETYKTSCSEEDLAWMFNFRGHKNFQPLWLDSNAFIWNSRRARMAATNRQDQSYYTRPFASRFSRSKQAWASYLFYREEDAAAFQTAGDQGGGNILYITDRDEDQDNLADYKLFTETGCGDQGVSSANPEQNCNMVPWETAASTPSTLGHLATWSPEMFSTPDMGFMQTFGTFEQRMARFNQALDRHTNWGPTSYYMQDASKTDAAPNQIKFMGSYSPVVACSYDISASHGFASGSYPSTPAFEQGHTKWMYVMRFPSADYYNEADMKAGREMDFMRHYYNETSLSNDHFRERALDRFGFVPAGEMYAQVYFVYGSRGEEAPSVEAVPAP